MPRTRLSGALLLLPVLLAACAPAAAPLVGTELAAAPAPEFTLTDGISGRSLRLADQRGKVVALAFLYTRCPDVCPLTADTLRQAQEHLDPAERDAVLFVAITVDPAYDTPAAVQAFAAAHRLERSFAYLVGTAAELEPVWRSYGVRVVPDAVAPGHSDAIYLIDRKGRERVLVHSDIGARDLVSDLRLLLRER